MNTNNNEISFSTGWWDNFLTTSNGMSKISVFENCLTKEETKLIRRYLLDIISTLGKLKTNQYGYRVYIDGAQLQFNDMFKIYEVSPLESENIEDWTKRAFGDKKFGIIINSGEKFNLKLSKLIALKMKPLLDKVGFPIDGINFTLFIGNYDKTPLGIHVDPPGENVLHFHLGPGGKTMYTWSKEEYDKLLAEQDGGIPVTENLLPHATAYTFQEGDLYFMPQGEYHIGTNDGLSMALTFWFYNHSKNRIAKRLQTIITDQYLQSNNDLLKPDKNDLEDLSNVNETLALYQLPNELSNLTYYEVLKQSYKDLRYTTSSNAGYRTSPFPKETDIAFNLEDQIIIEQPFKILYTNSIDKEKIYIYVRGVKLEMKNFESIKTMIDEINKGEIIKVQNLYMLLDNEWSKEMKDYILNLLYKHHGISIINN